LLINIITVFPLDVLPEIPLKSFLLKTVMANKYVGNFGVSLKTVLIVLFNPSSGSSCFLKKKVYYLKLL
jgi:hypothetical protein